VPMFHVNAWGAPYAVPMTGGKLVLAGAQMGDAEVLQDLMESEAVDYALGVPTIWLNVLAYLQESGKSVASLQRVCVGGAACPARIIEEFRDRHDVFVNHAWGMTEMSPVGSYNTYKAGMELLQPDELMRLRLRQGRGLFGVEMKVVADNGDELAWDGESAGALKVRGLWVISAYYKDDRPAVDADGWFDTGDVATITATGFMQITDRSKDVIKSGGEWISSIQLENTAVNHPQVAEAAVIGVVHPKWTERPLLVVVMQPGQVITREEMLDWYTAKVASWWVPDDVVFVDELPHTATGKILKTELRKQLADYQLPADESRDG
jgi:acyl-CoA synthetase (AMP-forming)/AMP-acid ligase II